MITLIIKKSSYLYEPSGTVHFLCPTLQLESGCETRTKAPKSLRTSLLLDQVPQPATGIMKCHKKCKATSLPLPAWCLCQLCPDICVEGQYLCWAEAPAGTELSNKMNNRSSHQGRDVLHRVLQALKV